MLKSVLIISLGASLGAVLRWLAALAFNAMFPAIPLGTLGVNIIGSFCMGFALRLFEALPGLAPEWKLFICTGFLGALTTFSTFSAEMGSLLQQQRFFTALWGILLHVSCSLAAFFAGMFLHQALWRSGG